MSWQGNIRDEIRTMAPPRLRPESGVLLDANESPFGIGEEDAAALAQHLSRVRLSRYPESTARALREQVAAELRVDPAMVAVGNGTEELVRLLCATFSKLKPRETRPRVADPLPGPLPYRSAVLSQGARTLEMPLKDDFGLDLVAMDRHITGGQAATV